MEEVDTEQYFPTISARKSKGRKIAIAGDDDDQRRRKRRRLISEVEIEEEKLNDCSSDSLSCFNADNIPILHSQPLRKPTDDEINDSQATGIHIKRGKFSPAENAQILQNYRHYVSEFGGVYSDLFGVGGRAGKSERQKSLRFHHFHQRLAHGLSDRHVWYVYLHARQICHPDHNGVGSQKSRIHYTPEESNTVLKMRVIDGRDFVAIGAAINKTPKSVCDHFHLISTWGGDKKTGAFDHEELLKLLMCVSDIQGFTNLNAARRLTWSEINWTAVQMAMGDRSIDMCQIAWQYIILPYCQTPSRGQLYFLCSLVRVYAREGDDIPWDELARDVGLLDAYLARTYFHMRKRTVFAKWYPEIDVSSASLKYAARKMMKYLKTKRIRSFAQIDMFGWDELYDIPPINSKHTLSLE